MDDLMLLCGSHHRLLHEGRFTIEQDYRGHWFFRRPDGRAIPACGYRPEDMTDDDVGTAEAYCHAHASAEACPSAEAWRLREASAEVLFALQG